MAYQFFMPMIHLSLAVEHPQDADFGWSFGYHRTVTSSTGWGGLSCERPWLSPVHHLPRLHFVSSKGLLHRHSQTTSRKLAMAKRLESAWMVQQQTFARKYWTKRVLYLVQRTGYMLCMFLKGYSCYSIMTMLVQNIWKVELMHSF